MNSVTKNCNNLAYLFVEGAAVLVVLVIKNAPTSPYSSAHSLAVPYKPNQNNSLA